MNKFKILIGVLIMSLMFVGCGGCNGGSDDSDKKCGEFAVKKVETAVEKSMAAKSQMLTESGMMKSVVDMPIGDVNSAMTQYFILQNTGDADITDIKMAIVEHVSGPKPIEDTDFPTFKSDGTLNAKAGFEVNENFSVKPNKLTVINPVGSADTIQLISVLISNGENQNGVGYDKDVLKGDIDNIYVIITGESNGTTLYINVQLKMFANYVNIKVTNLTNPTGCSQDGILYDAGITYYGIAYGSAVNVTNTGTVDVRFKIENNNKYMKDDVVTTVGTTVGDNEVIIEVGKTLIITEVNGLIGTLYNDGYIFDESLITFKGYVLSGYPESLLISRHD